MLEFIVCFYILGVPSLMRIWGLEKTGSHKICVSSNNTSNHGLRTPNEGINQRYLKNWANAYAYAVPKNLGVRVNFRPCSEGYFLSGRP